jgi:hypothetical protein
MQLYITLCPLHLSPYFICIDGFLRQSRDKRLGSRTSSKRGTDPEVSIDVYLLRYESGIVILKPYQTICDIHFKIRRLRSRSVTYGEHFLTSKPEPVIAATGIKWWRPPCSPLNRPTIVNMTCGVADVQPSTKCFLTPPSSILVISPPLRALAYPVRHKALSCVILSISLMSFIWASVINHAITEVMGQ